MTAMNEIKVLAMREEESNLKPLRFTGQQEMREFVSGNLECIRFPRGIDLWVNEDFNFLNSEGPTLFIRQPGHEEFQVIYGNVFFASVDEEGNAVSLSSEQSDWIHQHTELLRSKANSNIQVVRFDLRYFVSE